MHPGVKALIEEVTTKFQADRVKRGPALRAKDVEKAVKNFNPHNTRIKRRSPRNSGAAIANAGFTWKGQSLAGSAGVDTALSYRKGKTDDVMDLAATAMGKKPASMVSRYWRGESPAMRQNFDHFMGRAKSKNMVVTPTATGSEELIVGKRKNVRKIQRILHNQDAGRSQRGASRQFGNTVGYPKVKTDLFHDRAVALFGHSPGSIKRSDVIPLPKPKRVGSLAVPLRRLPEELHEASVDYVTPEFLKNVDRFHTIHKRMRPERSKAIDYKIRGTPMRTYLSNEKGGLLGKPFRGSVSPSKGDPNLTFMDMPAYPRNKAVRNTLSAKPTIAHELGHLYQPETFKHNSSKPGYSQQAKAPSSFYNSMLHNSDHREVHANSIEAAFAIKQAKDTHVPASVARNVLRGGLSSRQLNRNSTAHHNTLINMAASRKGQRKALSILRRPPEEQGVFPIHSAGHGYKQLLRSKSQKSVVPVKVRQRRAKKFFKETNKAIEKVYGSRNTTGGTVNKFGHVKLARPIGRLPESREELIRRIIEAKDDNWSMRVDKYGKPHVNFQDKGKPGDYHHWEIHKPQGIPNKRLPDPPKPKVATIERPSTARDRVLAWRKANNR